MGNYILELPEHHVYADNRGFFDKMSWNKRVGLDKDGKAEAYSNHLYLNLICK